jgi:hypothetical protein
MRRTSGISVSVWPGFFRSFANRSVPATEHAFGVDDIVSYPIKCFPPTRLPARMMVRAQRPIVVLSGVSDGGNSWRAGVGNFS